MLVIIYIIKLRHKLVIVRNNLNFIEWFLNIFLKFFKGDGNIEDAIKKAFLEIDQDMLSGNNLTTFSVDSFVWFFCFEN